MSSNKSAFSVKELTSLAMLTAVAFVVVVVIHMLPLPKVAGFLSYDPKDVVIAIGGFLFGAMPAVAISVIVSVLEMVTVSTTGPWGLLMNVISTCAFVVPAALVYKRRHTLGGAVAGLCLGVVAMTAVMMLWNYLVTPIYMGVEREVVVGLLIPAFLPFNLIKAGLNAAITMLLYKPVVKGLRKAHLAPDSLAPEGSAPSKKRSLGVLLITLFVAATFVVLLLVLMGVI